MFRRIKDIEHPDEPMLSVFRDYGVVFKESRENLNKTAENRNIYQLVHPGWLITNRMKAWQGSVGISPHRGIVSGHYLCFAPIHGEHAGFLDWLFRSSAYTTAYQLLSRGVRPGQAEIDNDLYRQMPVILPPLDEQQGIAGFLNRETAQIDALVAKQRQLIYGLLERRESLAGHTVFSGLRGDELQDNDEAWLPPTPVTWPITQLGFAANTLAGYAFPSEGFTSNSSDTRLLRGVNVKPGAIDWSEVVYWDEDLNPTSPIYRLNPGDLVLGMDRPFIASGVRVASISEKDAPSLLLQRVMRIRPLANSDRRYLRHLFSTRSFYMYLEPMFTGISVPHISEWQVRKFRIPLPPVDEQCEIAHYLDGKTAEIDGLISKTQELIALSEERRAALITDAVTGRIDVSTGKPREGA